MNFFLIWILIGEVNLLLTREKREELTNLLVQKIDSVNFELYDSYLGDNIKYDILKINNLIEQYGFPKEYNYFEDTGKTPKIKNQGSCGSCWAFASTTALSYRYYKIGIDIDFSPQEMVSCYTKSCKGNNMIDSHLDLVKNGTVTEECLPYSSVKGEVEECPTSCKDGSDIKKRYYAKNTYLVDSSKNYYDIVTLIMDQLINFGPVVTQTLTYYDFLSYFVNKNCINEVYTYDGFSEYSGDHAMVIVGYGFLNNKYYWLIQNSWGTGCDNGLIKIEFGQVNVERVSFSEPYIEDENALQKRIDLTLHFSNVYCDLNISTTSSLDDWRTPLSLIFEDSQGKNVENYLRYICGVNSLFNDYKILSCYYDSNTLKFVNGEYKLKDYNSLGKENIFYVNDLMKTIKIHGLYAIKTIANYPLYISEIGSRIIFQIEYKGLNNLLPKFNFFYEKKYRPLNCNIYKDYYINKTANTNLIYCDFSETEFNYFNLFSNERIVYEYKCGNFYSDIIVTKLDKEKYPVFRIKKFLIPSNNLINNNISDITTRIIADVEGSISSFRSTINSFKILTNIEKDNINITTQMKCIFKSPNEIINNFTINCTIFQNQYNEKNNYYILPFYYIEEGISPFEILLNNSIKSSVIPLPAPDDNDNDEDDNLSYRIIIITPVVLVIILIIIIIVIRRHLKKKNSNITVELINKDILE